MEKAKDVILIKVCVDSMDELKKFIKKMEQEYGSTHTLVYKVGVFMLSVFKRVVGFRYVDMLRSIFIAFQHTDYIKICLYGTLSSIDFATVDEGDNKVFS